MITNFHVVKGSGPAGWAGLADTKLYHWDVVGIDPTGDLGLIKMTGKAKSTLDMLTKASTIDSVVLERTIHL